MSLLLGGTDRRYFKILSVYILLRFINVESKIVPQDALTAPETMLCGGLAGVCFWTCVFPMDVVKSRIQASCYVLFFV